MREGRRTFAVGTSLPEVKYPGLLEAQVNMAKYRGRTIAAPRHWYNAAQMPVL